MWNPSDQILTKNRLCGMNFIESDQCDDGDWACTIEECETGGITSGYREDEGNGYIVSATVDVEGNIYFII